MGAAPYRTAPPSPQVPPRRVPRGLSCWLLFGGALNLIGWFLLAFGGLLFLLVWRLVDLGELWQFRSPTVRVRGVVFESSQTSHEDWGKPVFRMRYRFTDLRGVARLGVSYRTGREQLGGVVVEYPERNPAGARVVGARRAPQPPSTAPVGLVPLVGVVLVGFGQRRGRALNRLLHFGVLAEGRMLSFRDINAKGTESPQFTVVLGFDAGGSQHEVEATTLDAARASGDAPWQVLYWPGQPGRAVVLEELPRRPRIEADGSVAGVPRWLGPLSLLLPGAAVLVFLLGLLLS